MDKSPGVLKPNVWKDFLTLKNEKDIFLDGEHYLSILFKWMKDNSYRFNRELLEKYRIDTILELNNIVDYLGCDADMYLDREIERVFKNMPKTEELFLMRIGDTLWDLVRKRSGKDCPRCSSDELNYVLAKTEKECKIVLKCDICGWTEHLDGTRWREGTTRLYPIGNEEMKKLVEQGGKRQDTDNEFLTHSIITKG